MKKHGFGQNVFFVFCLILVVGCEDIQHRSEAIDPPPFAEQSRTPAPSLQTDPKRWLQIVVTDSDGMRVPLAVRPPKQAKETEQLAKVALEWMTVDHAREILLPVGFRGILPAKTEINQITFEANEKKLILDVSSKFSAYEANKERGMLEAIGWSMAKLPNVDEVELHVQGKKLVQMPVDQTPIIAPLNENVGLNLAGASVNDPSLHNWEYVYEQKQTPNGYVYQVPVYQQQSSVLEVNASVDEEVGRVEEPLNPWELE